MTWNSIGRVFLKLVVNVVVKSLLLLLKYMIYLEKAHAPCVSLVVSDTHESSPCVLQHILSLKFLTAVIIIPRSGISRTHRRPVDDAPRIAVPRIISLLREFQFHAWFYIVQRSVDPPTGTLATAVVRSVVIPVEKPDVHVVGTILGEFGKVDLEVELVVSLLLSYKSGLVMKTDS